MESPAERWQLQRKWVIISGRFNSSTHIMAAVLSGQVWCLQAFLHFPARDENVFLLLLLVSHSPTYPTRHPTQQVSVYRKVINS